MTAEQCRVAYDAYIATPAGRDYLASAKFTARWRAVATMIDGGSRISVDAAATLLAVPVEVFRVILAHALAADALTGRHGAVLH